MGKMSVLKTAKKAVEKIIKRDKSQRISKKNKLLKKNEKVGLSCKICNKKLRSRYHLKLHLTVHTGEKNYICGICEKGYQQKWNLITHVARVHSMEKPFKCNECGKAFGYSSHFKRHVKTHFLEKIEAPDTLKKRILNPYKCDSCDKSFESNYRLEIHSRLHTGIKPFICHNCGKTFTTKRLCKLHLQKNHIEKEGFVCKYCETIFPNCPSLKLHLISGHKFDNNGICQYFKTESHSKKTQNTGKENTNESTSKKETIPCEVCGKNLSRNSVKKHLNIHYRSRVYPCRFCKKEFLESGQRMVHERKHTGERPYLCDICGKGHSQYGNLLAHRKRYHKLTSKTSTLWKQNSKNFSKHNLNEELKTKNECSKFSSSENKDETFVETDEIKLINNTKIKTNFQRNFPSDNFREKGENNENVKCTGNETLEEFIKIASIWANKKFNESKCNSSLNQKKLLHLPTKIAKNNMSLDNCFGSINKESISRDNITFNSKENVEEAKNLKVKKVKEKMNKIIFEKIIEDLQKTEAKIKVLEIVDKINKKIKKKNFDVLKEFLKMMKTIPDNAIMKTKDKKVFWHCWICDSKLKTRHILVRHLLIHEPEENRPYKCEICQKMFTQSNNFKEHTMSHHQENQFYCEKCGNGFRHKSHFNLHLRKHDTTSSNTSIKKYECDYCGKKMNTNYQKLEHERIHTKEKPFLCKICGQQFAALSTLNRHQSTHAEASHQCSVCLKLFKQKSSLKRHLLSHYEPPYNRISCECGKTFSQSPSLKKHKMICKNRSEPIEKPFGCLACFKKFLTKSDLKRHMATHDSFKKFQCKICLSSLKTEETFKRHMRRHENSKKKVENDEKKSTV